VRSSEFGLGGGAARAAPRRGAITDRRTHRLREPPTTLSSPPGSGNGRNVKVPPAGSNDGSWAAGGSMRSVPSGRSGEKTSHVRQVWPNSSIRAGRLLPAPSGKRVPPRDKWPRRLPPAPRRRPPSDHKNGRASGDQTPPARQGPPGTSRRWKGSRAGQRGDHPSAPSNRSVARRAGRWREEVGDLLAQAPASWRRPDRRTASSLSWFEIAAHR